MEQGKPPNAAVHCSQDTATAQSVERGWFAWGGVTRVYTAPTHEEIIRQEGGEKPTAGWTSLATFAMPDESGEAQAEC